jgi:hypothetical protein
VGVYQNLHRGVYLKLIPVGSVQYQNSAFDASYASALHCELCVSCAGDPQSATKKGLRICVHAHAFCGGVRVCAQCAGLQPTIQK